MGVACDVKLIPTVAEPVYAPMGGIDQVDFTKRGGRYTSDFIWNTRWKDQVI